MQNPASPRVSDDIRLFGYRVADPQRRIVEITVGPTDALDILAHVETTKQFPEVEVDDETWAYCINVGDMEMIYVKDKDA